MPGPNASRLPRIPDYELLRLVGRGAYGEVWLGRNALGTLRAVKVVWRESFEDDRPYEREFHGIRKFEPVSRKHEGLVDLYHVGRNDEDGCFYYVMELADDVPAPTLSEGEYRPLTLREQMRMDGRLPVPKVLEIGAKLASALDHLHSAGLVHRDIKPSNIIFVGGTPKLADIGLVAGIDDARSFVGTEGFVPLEGPGTPGADVYSLGKVLYEMATGLDRKEFPRLPPVGGPDGLDADEFAELNEVLLRACEDSSAARYKTAKELSGDLLLLQGGKSLRRLRGLERQAAFLSRVGIAAAIVALVAMAAYYGSFKQIQRAQRAERRAVANVELLEMQKAEDLFQRDDASGALSYLAHVVRSNPTNRVAAERLMSALTWRNFVLPQTEPMEPDDRPRVVVYSPDGREIVSGSFDGILQFWDAESGGLVWEDTVAESGVFAMDWSTDARRLAIGARRSLIIYDYLNGRPLAYGSGHSTRVGSVQFSPDQKWILTGSYDGTARMWDSWTGVPDGRVFDHGGREARKRVRCAVMSRDGRYVATAGMDDDSARIWDAESGQPTSVYLQHGDRVFDVAFSPNSRMLATASDDGTARLWQVPDGLLLARLVHNAQVSDVVFSPDGGKIATTSEDGTARLWDVATFKPIGSPMRHRAWVKDIEFSPDGLKIVTGSEDNTARFWDASTAKPISEPMRHSHALATVRFSPSGDRLVTGVSSTSEKSLWQWRTTMRSAKSLPFVELGGRAFGRFGAGRDDVIISSGKRLDTWAGIEASENPEPLDVNVEVDFFEMSRDGRLAVVVSDRTAWIWDLKMRTRMQGPIEHLSRVTSAELSADGCSLLTGTTNGVVSVWNVTPGNNASPGRRFWPLPEMPDDAPEGGVFSCHYSRDGRLVVAACRDNKARLFDAASGRLLFEYDHSHWVLSAEFSPDGRRVVTSSNDREAKVWDTTTGEAVGSPMSHDNDIALAKFSPDGRRVVTASLDWTARVWDAADGSPVSEPMLHTAPVFAVAFSPDGLRVATGSVDGKARLWDAETGQPLSDAFQAEAPIRTVEFSKDGARWMIVPVRGDIRVAEVIRPRLPAPGWLPDLAEAVARQRLDEQQMAVAVPVDRLFRLKRELSAIEPNDPNAQWGRWFVSEPEHRTIAPSVRVSLAAYVRMLIHSRTVTGLREALFLDPTNSLAHAILARELLGNGQELTPKVVAEAGWHGSTAGKLAPKDPEVHRICGEVFRTLQIARRGTVSIPTEE